MPEISRILGLGSLDLALLPLQPLERYAVAQIDKALQVLSATKHEPPSTD